MMVPDTPAHRRQLQLGRLAAGEVVGQYLQHLFGRHWCLRETQVGLMHYRLDVSSTAPLRQVDKEFIEHVLLDSIPAVVRVDVTYARAKLVTRLTSTCDGGCAMTDSDLFTFHVRVNDGPEQTFVTRTGIYRDAAAALPAMLGLDLPIVVEIWCPSLLPEYGPYTYRVCENEFGGLVTQYCVRRP